MKQSLQYLIAGLFVTTAILTSCSTKITPTPAPTGNFAGQFIRIHLTTSSGKLDTTKANIDLSLTSAGTFAVTGDTTTLQAGSYGNYGVNGNLIQFVDKTITTAASTSTKVHLNGTLEYAFDGTNLQMFSSNDTLGYSYILTKQ